MCHPFSNIVVVNFNVLGSSVELLDKLIYRLHQDFHAISMVFCSGMIQSQLAKTDLATVCWFLELHEIKFVPGKAANRPVEHLSLRHLDQAASTNVYELQQLATSTLQHSNFFR